MSARHRPLKRGFRAGAMSSTSRSSARRSSRRCQTLPGGIVRAKGVVRFGVDADIRQVVQRVGTRQSIMADGFWTGGPSRLVLVGLRDALPGDSKK